MSVELKKEIERAKALIAKRLSLNEDTTQTAIVLPVLSKLGWDTTNPYEVYLEHAAGNLSRVDIALFVNRKPVVFIETKPARKGRLDDDAKGQVLKYCREAYVRLGVLTNGLDWYLYSSAESEATKIDNYAIRINLAEDRVDESAKNFEMYLSKAQVDTKDAHGALEEMRVDRILGETWEEMLQQGDKDLVSPLRKRVRNDKDLSISFPRVKKFIGERSSVPEHERRDAFPEKTKRVPHPKAQVVRNNKEMSPSMKALLALLRKEPTATQARIAEVLGITRSGAYSARKRAEENGYISKTRQGRTCTHKVLAHSDSESEALPEAKGKAKVMPAVARMPKIKQRLAPETRPRMVQVFGEEIEVASWREIMQVFLTKAHEKKPEGFLAIVNRSPKFAVSKERPDSVPKPLPIGTSGIWVSGRGSGKAHYATCESIRIKLNISENDFVCL